MLPDGSRANLHDLQQKHMLPVLDLYCTDPARYLTTAG